MELEAIILRELTQEKKTKFACSQSLHGSEMMKTHGHKEGNTRHWRLLEGGGWEEGEEQKKTTIRY